MGEGIVDENQKSIAPAAPESGDSGTPQGQLCRPFDWPTDFMKRKDFKKGDVVFSKGDAAACMFYIKKGAIKLMEIDKVLGEGQVLGEMGIFSPFKQRTVSAVCTEDLETYTMGREEVLQYFQRDPARGLDLVYLSFQRFIENLRAETEAIEKIESELRIAQEIQSSMLPKVFPSRTEFEIFAMMDPAKEVGGDFYDFFFIDEDRLCLVIGDVSGKGVPAALFMAITRTLIRNEALKGVPTNDVMCGVNRHLCPENDALMFVTIFCAVLDIKTGTLKYCNAGHNPPLIVRKNGDVAFLKMPSGFVVGVMPDTKLEEMTLSLEPGDAIFLYTDGVTEAMSTGRKLFSEERLKRCVEGVKDRNVERMIDAVRQEVMAHEQGAEQSDDITMLALRYKGGA